MIVTLMWLENRTMFSGSESPADHIKVYNGRFTCEQAVKVNVPVSLHADGYNTLTHLPRHQTSHQEMCCMFYIHIRHITDNHRMVYL